VSLIEHDTIHCEYSAYFEPKKDSKKFQKIYIKRYCACNFLVWTLQYLKQTKTAPENMKNCPENLLIIGPNCFSVLPTGPVQILSAVP
jgi:hypothetical protein